MDILNLIKTRRSVREFTDEPVSDQEIEKILEAARWAPSGLNNQPWRFLVIKDKEKKDGLGAFTTDKPIIKKANLLIVVFLDKKRSYDRTKDVQAIGACIENMLLEIHALNLGACWLGQILNQREEVERFLKVSEELELMAVLAIGHPTLQERKSSRRPLNELLI